MMLETMIYGRLYGVHVKCRAHHGVGFWRRYVIYLKGDDFHEIFGWQWRLRVAFAFSAVDEQCVEYSVHKRGVCVCVDLLLISG